MKSIVLLGGNKLHRGFAQIKDKLGVHEVIVIDWNETPDYMGDKHYKLDTKDYNGICKLDIDWESVSFVYTSSDITVDIQKRLHERIGLQTPSDEAIMNALIKSRMRNCWIRADMLNKYSEVVENIKQFEGNASGKYIFKPNCSSGSRNITILKGDDLIPSNIEKAINFAKEVSYDKLCIVEEFIEGTEYTVDMLGDGLGNVAVYGISKKYHTPYNSENKIATKLHYAPSDVSREDLENIAMFGCKCFRSIGLSNSFGHLEVIVKDDGEIVPIEIGARSSGYIATTLIDAINDTCYLGEYEKVLHGGTVKNGLIFDGLKSSMYYFYDIKPGKSINTVTIMDYLPKGIISCGSDRTNIVKDKEFTMINADHERYGFEILAGDSNILNIETVEAAEKAFNDAFIE